MKLKSNQLWHCLFEVGTRSISVFMQNMSCTSIKNAKSSISSVYWFSLRLCKIRPSLSELIMSHFKSFFSLFLDATSFHLNLFKRRVKWKLNIDQLLNEWKEQALMRRLIHITVFSSVGVSFRVLSCRTQLRCKCGKNLLGKKTILTNSFKTYN